MEDIRNLLFQFEYIIWLMVFAMFMDNVPAMVFIYTVIFLIHALISASAVMRRNRPFNLKGSIQHFFIMNRSSSTGVGIINRNLILTIINRILILATAVYFISYIVIYLN